MPLGAPVLPSRKTYETVLEKFFQKYLRIDDVRIHLHADFED